MFLQTYAKMPDLRACWHLYTMLHMVLYFVSLTTCVTDLHFHLFMFVCTWSISMMVPTLPMSWCQCHADTHAGQVLRVIRRLIRQTLRVMSEQPREERLVLTFSLAFGGRGCFFSSTSRGRRKTRVFNATLGYPGEGPVQNTQKRSRELVATHEVADCTSCEVFAPASAKWEACVIMRQTRDAYDVKITSDGAYFPNIPKRFVRPIHTRQQESTPDRKRGKKTGYGWSQREAKLLLSAEKARLEALTRGECASQRNVWIRAYLAGRGVQKRFVIRGP